MVLYCIENNKGIDQLDISEFKSFYENIEEDVYEEISLSKCVSGRNLPGGPAKESVMASIEKGIEFLSGI
jgi:argininosuccinate lyase